MVKIFSSFLFFCLTIFCNKKEDSKKYEVKGELKYTSSYCGGARPPDEMLLELQTPKPLHGKKIFIKKGKQNEADLELIDSAVTDINGHFFLLLPSGDYVAVGEEKKDKKYCNALLKKHAKATQYNSAIDVECLNNWFKTPDFTFTVKNSNQVVNHVYHKGCQWNETPCTQYTGPLPP